VASDFFQVARLAAFVQFWRLYHSDSCLHPESLKN
jgi:hypothetical protein